MSHKVFRDAIHNMIPIHREEHGPASDPVDWGDALILALIDTPEMQRQRRIRQLGLASYIYPSAEHSRFSHALGVLHLTKRILKILLMRHPGLFTVVEILQIKSAALLHDIGHGPYSHVFEEIFSHCGSHEIWGWRIVSEESGVHRAILAFCQQFNLPKDDFLNGLKILWGLAPSTGILVVGRQIISGQLDADRMDYLLRDAHFTGVAYGRFDLEWLLHSLHIREVAGTPRLCVEISRGPTALENYIAARDHMYRQVYDHKTVRAFEVLLRHLFRTLSWLRFSGHPLPDGSPPELALFLESAHMPDSRPALRTFLALDDAVLEYALGHWATHTPSASPLEEELRWKSRLLRHRHPVYRRLAWQQPGDWPQTEGGGSDLIGHVEAAQALENFFRERADQSLLIQNPDGAVHPIPIALLVQVDRLERAPYAHLSYHVGEKGAEPVLVISANQQVTTAEEASPLIRFLGQERRRVARVFVDPRALRQVQTLVREQFHHPALTLIGI